MRNRIGLCALLPPDALRGRQCIVEHPDGTRETGLFPHLVNPVQPFLNIRALEWENEGLQVHLQCLGDIFEVEDQRNWGDASYKLYSTPHDLPLPVAVSTGDRVEQEIRVGLSAGFNVEAQPKPSPAPTSFFTGNTSFPFPGVGYSYNPKAQTPDGESLRLLRRLSPDHYRVEIFLPGNWKDSWRAAVAVAGDLSAGLHVVLFAINGDLSAALKEFLPEAGKQAGLVKTLLMFSGPAPLSSPEALALHRAELALRLPGTLVGSGTDSYFSHWNQQAAIPENPGDFVSWPVNPQVHQPDDRTLVENAGALADMIDTTRFHSPGARMFTGPVTLKARYNPDAIDCNDMTRFPYQSDVRQTSLLAAAWTAIVLRYLYRADKITLFDISGEAGLIPGIAPAQGIAGIRVFPVYLLLREIAAFKPARLLQSRSQRPTIVDGLVLENKNGERLMIFCNFSAARQTLQLKTESWKSLPLFSKTLSPQNVEDFQEDGEKFRSAPYSAIHLSEGNSCRIAGETILFLTTLQDWSFS